MRIEIERMIITEFDFLQKTELRGRYQRNLAEEQEKVVCRELKASTIEEIENVNDRCLRQRLFCI